MAFLRPHHLSYPALRVSAPKIGSDRLEYFDTIRGLAALAVVVDHYVFSFGLPARTDFVRKFLTYTPLHVCWDGFAAVSLFFVLSGTVLSIQYFRESEHQRLIGVNLPGFIVNRWCRIWLPFVVALLVTVVLSRLLGSMAIDSRIHGTGWLTHFHLASVGRLQVVREGALLWPCERVLLPQAWTLMIEMSYSCLIPIAILIAGRAPGWLMFAAVIGIALLGMSPFAFHFALGVVIARFFVAMTRFLTERKTLRLFVGLIGFFFYTIRHNDRVLRICHAHGIVVYATGMGAAMILVFVASDAWFRALFLHWILVRIGQMSYSLYLCHLVLLVYVTPLVLSVFPFRDAYVMWYSGLFFTLVATLTFSSIFYVFIERPSVHAGKAAMRFVERILSRTRGRIPEEQGVCT